MKSALSLDEDMEFMPGFMVHFGSGHHQRLHLDFKNAKGNEWVMHGALCGEGMWLHVVVHITEGDKVLLIPRKIHILFGHYLLLRSDVVHSGICGTSGNIRFHMVFKSQSVSGDSLLFMDKCEDVDYPEVGSIDEENIITITDTDRCYKESVLKEAINVHGGVPTFLFDNIELMGSCGRERNGNNRQEMREGGRKRERRSQLLRRS